MRLSESSKVLVVEKPGLRIEDLGQDARGDWIASRLAGGL